MNRIYLSPRCILLILCLLFSFIGCGGGGGGSGSDGGTPPPPPTISYVGLTTPATITEANSEDMIFGSLLGVEAGGYFSLTTINKDEQGKIISNHPKAIDLPLILKNTAERIYFFKSNQYDLRALARTETDTINGNCGGSGTYTLNINDASGDFDGTFNFLQYCEDNVVISGDTDISGTVNLATGEIITITYAFENLTIDEFIYNGNVSVNDAVTPQIITLDLLVKDSTSDKVYWAKDYTLLITEINVTDIEIEVTGTYYDPDQGYVTVSTPEPFLVSIEDWPISGILLCVGDKNTKARLTAINEYSYRIEADTDGNDVYDYDSNVLIWPGATPPPVPPSPPPEPPTPPPPPPTNQAWTTKASMPTARNNLAASAVNEKIYAIGGHFDSTDSCLGTVEEFSPLTNMWLAKNSMPTARCSFGIGAVNGKIYAIGGRTFDPNNGDIFDFNIVEEYDPVSDVWLTKSPMQTARWGFAAAVVNDKIYAIGGQSDTDNSILATVEEYDASIDTWTLKAPMPTARRQLSASVVNGKIYALGGWTVNGNTEIVEEYDPETDTWATKANMPRKRFDHVSEAVNGSVFVFGDFPIASNKIVERYIPTNDEWTLKTPMPEGGSGFAASVVNDKIYVMGVGDYSKVYEYDPSLDP